MELEKELQLAKKLAIKAGAEAMARISQLKFWHKPHDQGPVSDAEIAIDQEICQEIRNYFPNDNIISEESFSNSFCKNFGGRTWFIDPIDGTSSYISGGNDFAVMIGLAINGIPRMGVVFEPEPQILWAGIYDPAKSHNWATKKVKNLSTMKIILGPLKQKSEPLILAVSRNNSSRKQKELIEAIKPKKLLALSSVGVKAMRILDGTADLYVPFSSRIKLWDTCAPAAIMFAAGGIMRALNGDFLDFLGPISHGHPIIVANFCLKTQMLEAIQKIAA